MPFNGPAGPSGPSGPHSGVAVNPDTKLTEKLESGEPGQAKQDLDVLLAAEEIKKDNARVEAAMNLLKEQQAVMENVKGNALNFSFGTMSE